jgi:hypothetical protein
MYKTEKLQKKIISYVSAPDGYLTGLQLESQLIG